MWHGSIDISPNESLPAVGERVVRQRDCRLLQTVVEEHGGAPRRDQSTPRDENEVFHAHGAESSLLRPFKPANQVVSDVVLKYPSADGILAVAVMRKSQKGSVTPALICETFSTERMSTGSICQGQGRDPLSACHSARIVKVGLRMHIAGVVVSFGQNCFTDIGQWANIQRFVTLWWHTMPLIRGVVPWKRDIEHPKEKAVA